jgi:two-component system, chemotaxis family, CheB/CheR fusion protein
MTDHQERPAIEGSSAHVAALARSAAALRERNRRLEQRLEERTASLAEAGAALEAERADRQRAERARNLLLRQLATAEEEERRRISLELHDRMGQLLTGLLLGLRALQREAGADERDARLDDLVKLTDQIAREVQSLALELRPPALDNLGLRLALQSHLESWSDRHGLEADFHSTGLEGERFPREVEITLYRVVQEGLTNVFKHAGATRVSLLLERRSRNLIAILEDDGAGFDVEEALASPEGSKRLGLRGMRERLAVLGGTLVIESSPGSGTTVFARIPASAGASAEAPEAAS